MFFSKIFFLRVPALSVPEQIFMEILPLQEYFPRSSSPCTSAGSSAGAKVCLPGHGKQAGSILPAVAGEISVDRKIENHSSKRVRPSQLPIRVNM